MSIQTQRVRQQHVPLPAAGAHLPSAVPVDAASSKWHAFAATWLGESFDALDASIYFIALYPALSDLLHTTSDSMIGWIGSVILSTFMIGWGLGSLLFGLVADSIGRVKAMTLSIMIYAVASGLCAMSHNWTELAICRFLVGIGIGGEISIGTVLLAEHWPGKGRIWSICAMQSSFSVGCLLTAAFNLGLGHQSWRWLFVVGMIPALLTLYIRLRLDEPSVFRKVSQDKKSAKAKPHHQRSNSEATLLSSPLREVFNRVNVRKTLIVTLLAAVAIVGYWAVVSWIPAWINQLTGSLAVEERSAATTMLSIGGILACLAGPILMTRWGLSNTFKLGYGGSLIACVLMYLLIKSYGIALLCSVFAVGFFTMMPFLVLCVYVPEVFPTNLLGTASGVTWSVGRFVAAAAAIGGGRLIEMFGGSFALAGATVAWVYGIGIIASFFLPALGNPRQD